VARSLLLAAGIIAIITGLVGMHIVSSPAVHHASGAHTVAIGMHHVPAEVTTAAGPSDALMSPMAPGCVLAVGTVVILAVATFPQVQEVSIQPAVPVMTMPQSSSRPCKPPPPLSLLSVNRQ
jgi:hypothetical protein